jgi:hypothetical protein
MEVRILMTVASTDEAESPNLCSRRPNGYVAAYSPYGVEWVSSEARIR